MKGERRERVGGEERQNEKREDSEEKGRMRKKRETE